MKTGRSHVVEVINNFFLRLFSAFLSTGIRQFITLPFLASMFAREIYGTILTINSVANIVEVSLGNTLNNTRIVTNSAYEEKKYQGDFNCFVLIAVAIGSLCSIALSFLFPHITIMVAILLWLVISLGILNGYYIVGFTMRLMFRDVFFQSAVVGLGTLIGIGITKLTGLWPFSFLVGNLFGLIFLYYKTPLMKERIQWSPLAKITAKKWEILTLTSLLSNAMVYLDRLLLYPILGGGAVAVFTTATFFGKCVAALIPSASNVLLAYFSKNNYKMRKDTFIKITGASLFFCFVCFIVSLPLAPWITSIFYPSLIDEATHFLLLANAAALLAAAGTISQTIVLKFCKTFNLLLVQILYSLTYLGGGLLVLPAYGIYGFCWVAIMANIIRLSLLIGYGYKGVSII